MNLTKKLIYFFGALGGLLFGYDTAVISGALLFITRDFKLTGANEGLVVSSLTFGAIFGAILGGSFADRFGRKYVIIVLGAMFTIGAGGSAIATNINILLISRLLLGLSVGAASGLVPMYLAEMAPAEGRGRVAALNTVMNALGILMGYIMNNVYASTGNWHAMLGWAALPSIILMIGMVFMPESPRWLFQHKSAEASRKVLLATRDKDSAEAELESIKATVEAEKGEGSLKMLFEPWLCPAIIAGIGVSIFQQILGSQTISYYTPSILNAAGFDDTAAIAGTIGIGIVFFVGVIIGMNLIDRIGRKKLLIIGNVGMSASLFLLVITTELLPAWSLVVFLCIFTGFYACSWSMTTWIVLSEIFPLKIRGMAVSACSAILWVACTIVAQVFPMVQSIISANTLYIFFAVMGLISIFFVSKFVPETKGSSLEQIEMDLINKYREKSGGTILNEI